MPFLCWSIFRRQALRAPSERLERFEGGNTGRQANWPYRFALKGKTAVRSAPGRSTECRGYKAFRPKRKFMTKSPPVGAVRACSPGGNLANLRRFEGLK